MLIAVKSWLVGVLGVVCAGAAWAAPVQLQGAGATFPAKVYERWSDAFSQVNNQVAVNYKPTGSGDGVKQMAARAVQFGGTDTPLSTQALAEKGLVQIPTLIGGLVPVVNLPGVPSNRLVLSGDVLAAVMLNTVAYWDDERIAKLNPGISLPHKAIVRIVREDASGSSEAFAAYLALVSAEFKARVKVSHKPNWPDSGAGKLVMAKGNDGVVSALQATTGGLTYVSYDRVRKGQLTAVKLRNPKGQDVVASEDSFKEAILGSNLYLQGDDTASLLNVARKDAWPLTMTSYVLLDVKPKDKIVADWTSHYVYWCFMHGDELTKGTGFAPLPARVQAKLVSRLLQIHGPGGDVPKFIQP